MKKIALLGNPNSGKTTLFNALTGKRNKVANWAGVTVEITSAKWKYREGSYQIIDLPGCYSLCSLDNSGAPDELIATSFLFENKVDYIINIIDSSNLTRSLYLTTQLLELGIPILILMNKADLLTKEINIDILADKLNTNNIIACETNNSQSIKNLQATINNIIHNDQTKTTKIVPLPKPVDETIKNITNLTSKIKKTTSEYSYALNLIGGYKTKEYDLNEAVTNFQISLQNELNEDIDIIIAQARYDFIRKTTKEITEKKKQKKQGALSKNIDYFLTHKYLGIVFLFLIMYLIFAIAINIGNCFQSIFTALGEVFFVTGINLILTKIQTPEIAKIFLVQGLGQGITTLLSFFPIVFAMFYSIALLEETGYMPRAAFVTDRIMRLLHLPGKAFIPLIIGFSCNVPAILATRTLESYRDRIIAGLMTPFMMCNARLAVFAIFSSTFFPSNASLVIMAMYTIGILAATITGIIACRIIIPGTIQPLIMELPDYQMPKQNLVLKRAVFQTKSFCKRVGIYIIALSAIISILNSYEISDGTNLLTLIGQSITPLLKPLGIMNDNWAASVGILAGFVAKETIIITLSQLYHGTSAILAIPHDFFAYALNTINLSLTTTANDSFLQEQLRIYFQSNYAVLSYMVFNLLYIPCVSTMAAFAKETNWRWALFSTTWSITLAYSIAAIIFQISISYYNVLITLLLSLFALYLNILLARQINTSREIRT